MAAGPRKEVLSGVGVSPGIVTGTAYILARERMSVNRRDLRPEDVPVETARFKRAVSTSKDQLEDVRQRATHAIGREHAYIIDTHILILEDRALINGTLQEIQSSRVNAEWALTRVAGDFIKIFEQIDDEYLRNRRADVEHVVERILRNLLGNQAEGVPDLPHAVIIVAHDLTPSDTLQLKREQVVGFVTDIGGRTSHTAIMARSLEIPAVVALGDATGRIKNGDPVILDGTRGIVVLNPDPGTFLEYLERQRRYVTHDRELGKLRDMPARTVDGCEVRLLANLDVPDDVESVIEHGAAGIGLFRTEFLYMNRPTLPTEEEQFEAYRKVAERLYPHPVVFRTLDVGSDKIADAVERRPEANPALGLRAIRLCLKNIDLFRTQLRAILRASAYGDARILFPMISGLDELRLAKYILEEVRREMVEEEIPFKEDIKVGAMIEIPSAAVIADLIAGEADFFSVGTNDLIQYAMAIDRQNENVAYLYEPLHPAVLRLVRHIVESGRAAGIPVSMCGEMAGDPLFSVILLGLGFDELSMIGLSVPRVKKIIRSVTMDEARMLVTRALDCKTAAEAQETVYAFMRARFPEEITSEGEQIFQP
ncbi:MAG: phosphoenolpyruvate--protein phosphotransferase [Nitrospirae bacterium RBG_16_64_22]|nr:MAG: phosphoenolpyruvate--protein phosphotransferase [Nitrospirae bacterium RBG_16_64_22]